ncbi:MAG TPA: hypothetical protein VJJ28_00090 [Candidatus Paceibacterota bacterium]
MSKRQLLCVLGVWVMFFLFLGIPSSWHKISAILSGLAIIAIAYNILPDKNQNTDQNDGFSQK